MPASEDYDGFVSAVRERVSAARRQILRLRRRHAAYSAVFLADGPKGADARWILADLAKYCCADETTWNEDARVSDHLAARREVYLHIMKSLRLDRTELERLAAQTKEEDDDD